jgi:phytoene synthase
LREARAAIARGSKSFALASRLFDPPTRARATMLYAWCRHCDDVTDEQELGMGFLGRAGTMRERVAALREETHAALNGGRPRGTPFMALRRVADETGLPERYAMDLITGFEMDADERLYRTEADMLGYCYHVAGCVGVMMAVVMGVAPHDRATLERASDLGLAFQMNNIARDLIEDAARGRCYLPAQWLAEADIPPGEEAKPWARERLATVAARLVADAS